MTYAQIKQLALRQLDEDPHDMDEHGELLGAYINEGYQIAVDDHLKPREFFRVKTDVSGDVDISGLNIRRIVTVQESAHRFNVWATLDPMGDKLRTTCRLSELDVVAVVSKPALEDENDEPQIPGWAHGALADFACWRYLSNGNPNKQAKGNFYYGRFMQQMARLEPQGMRSVTDYKNLYTATDARWTR